MILTNFYNRTPQITSKIIIQLFSILSIADIIWIIYFSSAWIQVSEEEKLRIGDNSGLVTYWDSLWFIHGFVYFLAFVELIIKALLLYYLIADYKEKYSLQSLFNFSYDNNIEMKSSNISPDEGNQMNDISKSNDIGDFAREGGTNSFDEKFENNF
jgi:hypothetical protein